MNFCYCGKEKCRVSKVCAFCWANILKSKEHKELMSSKHKGQKAWNKNLSLLESTKLKISKTLKTFYKLHPEIRDSINKKIVKYLSPFYFQRGKNHPFFRGGLSIKYPLVFNKKLKIEIRKRDSYICQWCGETGFPIHHVDYDKNNNNKNNLITLCYTCHSLTNFNRPFWYIILSDITGAIICAKKLLFLWDSRLQEKQRMLEMLFSNPTLR